ncbi:MAG: UDP-N-acetylmuramoyl-L-alanyl-D-glutamate--2,6-diaminopimelate ligase [Leptospirales bacterium]
MTKTIQVKELIEFGWQTDFSGTQIEYSSIEYDTRKLTASSLFFAFDGLQHSAKDFVLSALQKKAVVFIDAKHRPEIDRELGSELKEQDVPVFYSDDYARLVGNTVSFLYELPSRVMECVGITGTNGKTTIAWGLFNLFNRMGKRAMYIGTLGVVYPGRQGDSGKAISTIDTGLTTPPVLDLHRYLARAVDEEVRYAFIEVSSHGMEQGRLAGVHWGVGVFTNLTRDHLDYHKTMDNYFYSKRKFFERLVSQEEEFPGSVRGTIINGDDGYGQKLVKWLQEQEPRFQVLTLGEKGGAEISQIENSWSGYNATLTYDGQNYPVITRLLGRFNIWNALAAVFVQFFLGEKLESAIKSTSQLEDVPGRMESITYNNAKIFIDYAHTPDALENVIFTILEMKPSRFILVFGCGGDRDKEKRPLMGKAASQTDEIIITNDNPRTEEPEKIANDIIAGVTGDYKVILDREKAICQGLQHLKDKDVLLIAGKGHEDYQIIGKEKTHFNDREVVEQYIEGNKKD